MCVVNISVTNFSVQFNIELRFHRESFFHKYLHVYLIFYITGICIPGLTETPVTTLQKTMNCLQQGSSGRVTGSTAMNNQSSRSHAIFTLTIHQQKRDDSNSAMTAKFHLVDLAGSER